MERIVTDDSNAEFQLERLLRRRKQLRELLHDQAATILYTEHDVGDFADGATESDEAAANSRVTAVEHRELQMIRDAIERIHKGQYGICEECAGGISAERLKYLPYATLCIECQRTAERGR